MYGSAGLKTQRQITKLNKIITAKITQIKHVQTK